jgi:hypothetical protein
MRRRQIEQKKRLLTIEDEFKTDVCAHGTHCCECCEVPRHYNVVKAGDGVLPV